MHYTPWDRNHSGLNSFRVVCHRISITALIVLGIITFCVLLFSVDTENDLTDDSFYTDMAYPEFLIKYPDYKLKANNVGLSKYERPDIKMPIVVELTTANPSKTYEVFVGEVNEKVTIIKDKLYVRVKGSYNNVGGLTFSVAKDASIVEKLKSEHAAKIDSTEKIFFIFGRWFVWSIIPAVFFVQWIFFFFVNFILGGIGIVIDMISWCGDIIDDWKDRREKEDPEDIDYDRENDPEWRAKQEDTIEIK